MPARSGAGYTALAFSNADAGYSVIHMRPSARYRNPAEASILAITSDTLPTRILEPNPPLGVGHRNAMTAAPKPDRDITITATIDRFRNCRRVTPMASASGGTYSARSPAPVFTSSGGRRSISARASTSRPDTGGSG